MEKKTHQKYWPNSTTYFLTGSTFLHFPYFKTDGQKYLVLRQIMCIKERFQIPEIIFNISINHYHMKFFLKHGLDLARIKQYMHGGVSYLYRRKYPMKYREMWHSHRALVVVSREMDQRVTGYIIGNLLKHKEVSTFRELDRNPFSSYRDFSARYGDKYARALISSIIDVNENSEGYVDTHEMKVVKIPSIKVDRTPSAKAG
ncbi:MAG: hypothetical protein V1685_07080 [Parcubacteria group bacterium]